MNASVLSYFDGATKIGRDPCRNRCNTRPTTIIKNHHLALVHKKEMLSTIHQRTQVDHCYEYILLSKSQFLVIAILSCGMSLNVPFLTLPEA